MIWTLNFGHFPIVLSFEFVSRSSTIKFFDAFILGDNICNAINLWPQAKNDGFLCEEKYWREEDDRNNDGVIDVLWQINRHEDDFEALSYKLLIYAKHRLLDTKINIFIEVLI